MGGGAVHVLKGALGKVLMPFPMALTGLLLGLVVARRFPRFSRWLMGGALALLLLSAWDPVASGLLHPLESRYGKLRGQIDDVRYVVVMGAAHYDHPVLPLSNRPNDAALYRLIEGISIYRRHPGSRLVLSGSDRQPEAHAEILARVARELGVPSGDIVLQQGSRDTAEEAERLVALLGTEGMVVTTSAAHMARTLYWFRHFGADPVPAPTHFMSRVQGSPWAWPSLGNVERTTFAWHEYLGLLWAWITAGAVDAGA